jgi:plasmid maintenance system antidote protein VapI
MIPSRSAHGSVPRGSLRRGQPGSLPAVLNQLQEWHGLSNAAMGRVAGLNARTVGSWCSGETRPTDTACRQLERAFDLAPGVLLDSR